MTESREPKNPYAGDYHQYLEGLKARIGESVEYIPQVETPRPTNVFDGDRSRVQSDETKTRRVIKTALWTIGICILAVSLVTFVTQATLLLTKNAKAIIRNKEVQEQQGTSSSTQAGLSTLYVRADLDRSVFGADTPTSSAATTSNSKPVDLGIPGVTAIGFDTTGGDKVLTDNINKYSPSTLVVGGRQGEAGGLLNTIGGGDGEAYVEAQYSTLPKAVEPILNSKAYLVADRDTGEIILEKNADAIYPLASVSKLMTAVIVREKMDLQSVAIVSRDASNTYGAQGSLGVGEKIRLTDLLFPLLMESSNDAAEVFADQYGHAAFMAEMNKKAAALDMTDTYYGDPSGLDPKNTSTPNDLLKLARYIYKNDPAVYDMTRVKQFSIKNHTWYNRNELLPLAGYTGGKNGYIDQSLQTTVSMFDVNLAKGGVRNVVVIILKSPTKKNDAVKLLNYLKNYIVFQP